MRTLANFSIALHFIIVKLLIIVLATDVNCNSIIFSLNVYKVRYH